jgi:hypothetical protein
VLTSLAALALAACVPPASASVTLGQLHPAPGMGLTCNQNSFDIAQRTVASGNPYVVPGQGAITSWSTNAGPSVGSLYTLKLFRKLAEPNTYQVAGHDGPRTLTPSALNTFGASVPAQPGDLIGINDNDGSSVTNACLFPGLASDSHIIRMDSLADGGVGDFGVDLNSRINISAVFEPSNSFGFGKLKRNKRKGTAILSVEVPNPGSLVLGGKGVKGASAAGAVISKIVGAAGTVQLVIKAKGKQARKLKKKGKVGLKAKITYTPTGGDPATQTKKLKRKRR